METKELQRLNDKNLEYKNALKQQENQKKIKDDLQKQEQGKVQLNDIINEIGKGIR